VGVPSGRPPRRKAQAPVRALSRAFAIISALASGVASIGADAKTTAGCSRGASAIWVGRNGPSDALSGAAAAAMSNTSSRPILDQSVGAGRQKIGQVQLSGFRARYDFAAFCDLFRKPTLLRNTTGYSRKAILLKHCSLPRCKAVFIQDRKFNLRGFGKSN